MILQLHRSHWMWGTAQQMPNRFITGASVGTWAWEQFPAYPANGSASDCATGVAGLYWLTACSPTGQRPLWAGFAHGSTRTRIIAGVVFKTCANIWSRRHPPLRLRQLNLQPAPPHLLRPIPSRQPRPIPSRRQALHDRQQAGLVTREVGALAPWWQVPYFWSWCSVRHFSSLRHGTDPSKPQRNPS